MYDLIIIGAGPAGLTSSIYASCFHLKHLVIGEVMGGQLSWAPDIRNYPGFTAISGKDLTECLLLQAKNLGGEVMTGAVTKIVSRELKFADGAIINGYEIETKDGQKFQAKAVIMATGSERKKLGVPGEIAYTGKGVHYCATCEKLDYQGRVCGIIGGANSAVQAAVEIAQAAAKVYIIYRGATLRGDPIWLEEISKNPKIEVLYNTVVTDIVGDGARVTGVNIQYKDTAQQIMSKLLNLDKVFIEIGGVPGTALMIPLGVTMDAGGYIKVNDKLETNISGIFAAGDLVSYGLSIEQISSAVGLGARATSTAFAFIKNEKAPTLWGASQIKR